MSQRISTNQIPSSAAKQPVLFDTLLLRPITTVIEMASGNSLYLLLLFVLDETFCLRLLTKAIQDFTELCSCSRYLVAFDSGQMWQQSPVA